LSLDGFIWVIRNLSGLLGIVMDIHSLLGIAIDQPMVLDGRLGISEDGGFHMGFYQPNSGFWWLNVVNDELRYK